MVTLTLNGAPCLHIHLVWITCIKLVSSDFSQIAKFEAHANSSLSGLVEYYKMLGLLINKGLFLGEKDSAILKMSSF